MQHVVSNWNGKLVDDLIQTVRAINEVMTAFGSVNVFEGAGARWSIARAAAPHVRLTNV